MRDDDLTVWAASEQTGRNSSLEWHTEFEKRAIRRALAELVELGYLLDTGERRNNMTVWRMPRYEAWLARAENETPPKAPSRGRISGANKRDNAVTKTRPTQNASGS